MSVSYVLSHSGEQWYDVLKVRGWSKRPLYLSAKTAPIELAVDLPERTLFVSRFRRGVASGQQPIVHVRLGRANSGPPETDLTGGFLCDPSEEVSLQEHSCELLLASLSVSPFLSGFGDDARKRRFGEMDRFVEHCAEKRLECATWYPVEVCHLGIEIGLGVAILHTLEEETGRATATLRFVANSNWSSAIDHYNLHRFGRLVAEGRFTATE